MKENPNIFLIGFMGSGKSYWGRVWSEKFNLPFLDLDGEIERSCGMDIPHIFSKWGEEEFRRIERLQLRATISKQGCLIACGGGVPCFFDNMEWMLENGIVIYLKATVPYIHARIRAEAHKRPLLKNLSEEDLIAYIQKSLDNRSPFYEKAHHVWDVEKLSDLSLSVLLPGSGLKSSSSFTSTSTNTKKLNSDAS